MYHFFIFFSLFLIVSFIGWIVEVIYTFIETRKWVNRGFLLGPYCPIYGISSLLMMITLGNYKDDLFVLFMASIFICTIMEYITSYIMEKIFKARWWDYSHLPFNVNGRVCLSNSILFGIGAVLLLKGILPFILDHLLAFPTLPFYYISGLLLLLFLTDFILSFNIIFKFKNTVDCIRKDYTGEISDKVKKLIMKKSYPFRRLVRAFPNQIIIGIKSTFKRKKKER